MEKITSSVTGSIPCDKHLKITSSPIKLVDLCIRFVAKHLNHVESFVEFPDQIGKQIFSVAESLGMFEQHSQREVVNMKVFCEAYGQQVLHSLNLKENHMVLNNHLETIFLFTRLGELDLASCGLGDEHPLITSLSLLDRLLVLGLRDNALSDTGIQRMTSPMRMFRKGSMNLQKIDISDNVDISIKGVLHLKVFAKIQLLDLSRTSVESFQTRSFEKDMKMVQTTERTPVGDLFQVKTAGWAAGIIESWFQESHRKQKLDSSKPKRSHFYGRISRKVIKHIKPGNRKSVRSSTVLILIKQHSGSGADSEQKADDGDVISQADVKSIHLHLEPFENVSKNRNRTLQIDFKCAYEPRFNKKRTRDESNQSGDSDNEDKLLMEMYSGVKYRKQRHLSDLY